MAGRKESSTARINAEDMCDAMSCKDGGQWLYVLVSKIAGSNSWT